MRVAENIPNSSFATSVDAGGTRPVLIGHEGQPPLPAREYFAAEHDPRINGLVNRLFLPDSSWALPSQRLEGSLHSVAPTQLAARLLCETHPVYELAQHSLARINWFGYNDHGPLHIRRVVEDALKFGESAGFSVGQLRRLVSAAAFHDLGNLVNRDRHSFESSSIASAIFPELKENEESWKLIKRAVELHEIGAQRLVLPADFASSSGRERIIALRDIFGPEALALVVADKIQFTRERVNDRALSVPALMAHRYSQLNFYWETERAEFIPQDQSFVWNLRFRRDVSSREYQRFAPLVEAKDEWSMPYQAVLPQQFHDDFASSGKSHFESAEGLFWSLSEKLVQRLAECCCALWDDDKGSGGCSVKISFLEYGADEKVMGGVSYSVAAESLAEGVRQNREVIKW